MSGASADNVVLNSTSNPTIENTIVSGPGGELNCFAEAGQAYSMPKPGAPKDWCRTVLSRRFASHPR